MFVKAKHNKYTTLTQLQMYDCALKLTTVNFSAKELILKYDVSQKTIAKWKNRVVFEDKTSRPNTIKYALSDLEILIATNLLVLTWWALDEIAEAINSLNPKKIRSAVYRSFVREGINKVPEKEKEKAKKIKEYDPGYLHILNTFSFSVFSLFLFPSNCVKILNRN